MDITFEFAKLSDLQNIIDTYNSTIPSRVVTADLEPVTIENKMNWFTSHSPTKRPLWIIKLDNQYVGWMSFSSFYGRPAYDGTVEISIYLDQNIHRKGIGSACIDYAFTIGPQLGVKTLLGFIFDHNSISLNLFNKMGFKQWGHLPHIANMIDAERGLIIMGKRIV